MKHKSQSSCTVVVSHNLRLVVQRSFVDSVNSTQGTIFPLFYELRHHSPRTLLFTPYEYFTTYFDAIQRTSAKPSLRVKVQVGLQWFFVVTS